MENTGYETSLWLHVTVLSNIYNLNNYAASSQYFGSEFSFQSSLSARHVWIWGFVLIFFFPADLAELRRAAWGASLKRYLILIPQISIGFKPGFQPGHTRTYCYFSCSFPVDWNLFIRIIVPLQHNMAQSEDFDCETWFLTSFLLFSLSKKFTKNSKDHQSH